MNCAIPRYSNNSLFHRKLLNSSSHSAHLSNVGVTGHNKNLNYTLHKQGRCPAFSCLDCVPSRRFIPTTSTEMYWQFIQNLLKVQLENCLVSFSGYRFHRWPFYWFTVISDGQWRIPEVLFSTNVCTRGFLCQYSSLQYWMKRSCLSLLCTLPPCGPIRSYSQLWLL